MLILTLFYIIYTDDDDDVQYHMLNCIPKLFHINIASINVAIYL